MPAPTTTKPERAGELLERSVSLAMLAEAFAAVSETGRGQLVFVGGEAGVGKTALLRRFCDERAGGPRMLWGACDALFTPRPLGPLSEIAETVAASWRRSSRTAPNRTRSSPSSCTSWRSR